MSHKVVSVTPSIPATMDNIIMMVPHILFVLGYARVIHDLLNAVAQGGANDRSSAFGAC